MPEHFMTRSRARLALVSMTLFCAATAQGATGVRYGVASALDCKQPGRIAPQGEWIEASGVAVEGSPGRRMSLGIDEPVATDAFRVALNGAGASDLSLVEIQGTDGVWHKAWEGQLGASGTRFAQTCFEQRLPTKQVVQALRLTFRAAEDEVEVNHAALLRR